MSLPKDSQHSMLRFIPLHLALVLLIAMASLAHAQEEEAGPLGTGLRKPTLAEQAWMQEHFPERSVIRPNRLAWERVNEERAKYGEAPVSQEDMGVVADDMVASSDPLPMAGEVDTVLPRVVNNATEIWFPPIRSQGNIGSCVGWATTYYQMTYETARARNWNAASGDNAFIFSPKFTYNMINDGVDSGAWYSPAYALLTRHGSARWSTFPYHTTNQPLAYREWLGSLDEWRHAIQFRATDGGTISANGDEGRENIKAMLANGHILVISTNVNQMVKNTILDDPTVTGDDPYVGHPIAGHLRTGSSGHAMTLVGYNDYIWVDINGNGEIDEGEKGAFLIANSWGNDSGWGTPSPYRGFRWVAYDAVQQVTSVPGDPAEMFPNGRQRAFTWAYYIYVPSVYQPTLVAEVTLQHDRRSDLDVQLGKGNIGDSQPSTTWTPGAVQRQGGAFAFDGTENAGVEYDFAFDLRNLNLEPGVPTRVFFGIRDNASLSNEDIATLSSFRVTDAQDGYILLAENNTVITSNRDNNFQWTYVDLTWVPDVPVVTAEATVAETTEGSAIPAEITFTATPAPADDLLIHYSLSGTASPADYEETLSGTITIPAGQSSVTQPITAIDDDIAEPTETLTLSLAPDVAYIISDPSVATVYIHDNSPTLRFEEGSVAVSESVIAAEIPVVLNHAYTHDIIVSYAVEEGSAEDGVHFVASSGTITILAGATTGVIPFTVLDNDIVEDDDKTVLVTITGADTAHIGSPYICVYTILDNDDLSRPHSYAWGTVPSPQTANAPFAVTIEAHNQGGVLASAYSGAVNLSAWTGLDVILGTGSETWNYPFHTYFHDARMQAIYRAEEIGEPGGGIVRGLIFDVSTTPGQPLNNFTIRMKHTALVDYNNSADRVFELDGWTVVHQSDLTISQTGPAEILFDTPFHYNGTDNLLIDVSYNNNSYTGNGEVRASNESSGALISITARSDSNHGDPLEWTTGVGPNPGAFALRPNLTFTGGEALTIHPTSATLVNGAWSGTVTIVEEADNAYLRADDSEARSATSNLFDIASEGFVTVSFNVGAGDTPGPEPIFVQPGQPYGELPLTTRSHYFFAGWFTAEDHGDEVTASTQVTATENHTLFARWDPARLIRIFRIGDWLWEIDPGPGEADDGSADPVEFSPLQPEQDQTLTPVHAGGG